MEYVTYTISITANLVNNPTEYPHATFDFNIKVYNCKVLELVDENRSFDYDFPLGINYRLNVYYYPFVQNPAKCGYTL